MLAAAAGQDMPSDATVTTVRGGSCSGGPLTAAEIELFSDASPRLIAAVSRVVAALRQPAAGPPPAAGRSVPVPGPVTPREHRSKRFGGGAKIEACLWRRTVKPRF